MGWMMTPEPHQNRTAGTFAPPPVEPLTVMDLIYGRSRPDSIIALGSRRTLHQSKDVAPHYLAPVLVKDRNEMLPAIFEYCMGETQYLMPNTLSPSALHQYNREHLRADVGQYYGDLRERKIRYFHAANEHVRELNAIFVDLDVGKTDTDISAPMAIGVIADMAMREEIPIPSLAAFSGRGAYCVWLLTDEGTPQAPLNTTGNRAQWKLCLGELVKRTRDLKSDANATRLANWFKRPGTIDTNTGKQVVYMLFGVNDIRNVPMYSLPMLTKNLGLTHIDLEPRKTIEADPGAVADISDAPRMDPPQNYVDREPPAARQGRKRKVDITKGSETAKVRAYEIELIVQARKGIEEGLRHAFLLHYFWCVLRLFKISFRNDVDGKREAWRKAKEATWDLNKTFKPPLNESDFLTVLRPPRNIMLARSGTLAELLKVTEAEAMELNLQHIVPETLRKERTKYRFENKDKLRSERKDRTGLVDAMLGQLRDGKATLNFADIARKWGVNKMMVTRRAKALGIVAGKWKNRV